jgi:hypothetical protein
MAIQSDAKALTRPFTVRINHCVMPDDEPIEFVCNENQQFRRPIIAGRDGNRHGAKNCQKAGYEAAGQLGGTGRRDTITAVVLARVHPMKEESSW